VGVGQASVKTGKATLAIRSEPAARGLATSCCPTAQQAGCEPARIVGRIATGPSRLNQTRSRRAAYCSQVLGSWHRMPDVVTLPKSIWPYSVPPKIVLFGVHDRVAVRTGLPSFVVALMVIA